MLSYTEVLRKLDEESNHIKEYGVSRIGLFGSFARNQQTDKSDLDILVELKQESQSSRRNTLPVTVSNINFYPIDYKANLFLRLHQFHRLFTK